MSWPRRHELLDVDLDAYADDAQTPAVRPAQGKNERHPSGEKPPSVLEAADLARIPAAELLAKLVIGNDPE